MTNPGQRRPHAALDPAGRLPKAEKIQILLDLKPSIARRLRLLEIGTGSGVIAHYFATHPGLGCDVDAVDVIDQRQVTDGYRYQTVPGVELPFADASFDAVISNHVIEHVGDGTAQQAHLYEIARVLRTGGRAYLATPSRWQVVEPHYRIAFLSWLPKPLRSRYLRWRKAGDHYDCEPLAMPELETMLSATGLAYRNVCEGAIRTMCAIEHHPSLALRSVAHLPRGWLQGLRRFSPTHVYLLRPQESSR